MIKYLTFISFLLLSNCKTINYGALHNLSINGKNQNRFVENRKPNYGDGKPDGCIVLPDINLSIITLPYSKIKGIITNIDSKNFIEGAEITIFINSQNSINQYSNSLGEFEIDNSVPINKIIVNATGHRLLKVNFEKNFLKSD